MSDWLQILGIAALCVVTGIAMFAGIEAWVGRR
jgi:hypothetical protein